MTRLESSEDFRFAGVMPEASLVDYPLEFASDIAIHIDGEGVVIGVYVNAESPSIGNLEHWVGRLFSSFLTDESQRKFAIRLGEIKSSPSRPSGFIELNHRDNAAWEFPIRYTPVRVRDSDSFLLLGRDMQPIADVQQQLLGEQLARQQDQQKLRGAETRFRVVLEASETALVLVDPETSQIRDLNSAAATLLGVKAGALNGNALNQAFEGIRRGELMEALQAESTSRSRAGVEVVLRRNGKPLVLVPEYFRAAGEVGLLCRVAPAADSRAEQSKIGQWLNTLFLDSSDAFVILDEQGFICEVNEAFLVLADAAQLRDVRDRSLSDFLQRGEVDLRLLLDGARRDGRLRSYIAQFRSIVGTRASVDVSATHLRQRGGESGFGLILRQVSQPEQKSSDVPGAAVSEEGLKNVMDLVGTASLKELVSATSDVIERMCIETALQLTNNNRVAAAEMLGLSRQSLYVKLRKFDMLDGSEG